MLAGERVQAREQLLQYADRCERAVDVDLASPAAVDETSDRKLIAHHGKAERLQPLGHVGADLEEAFHQPRIDMSGGGKVVADSALAPEVIEALGAAFPVSTARRTIFPYAYACPAGVMRDGDRNMGCTEVMSPWGDAVSEHLRL